jgi:hypothetical protein
MQIRAAVTFGEPVLPDIDGIVWGTTVITIDGVPTNVLTVSERSAEITVTARDHHSATPPGLQPFGQIDFTVTVDHRPVVGESDSHRWPREVRAAIVHDARG